MVQLTARLGGGGASAELRLRMLACCDSFPLSIKLSVIFHASHTGSPPSPQLLIVSLNPNN